MNLTLKIKNTFKKDFKSVQKQGWDCEAIDEVVFQLQTCEILDSKLKDHKLLGEFKDFRECHIKGDLVIIYKRDDKFLELFHIGRHQDLFKGY
ncbi:type II toxin-antitoxin system mRNA interferase toxin, RelE/StbE family [Helicobacter sp. 16-1353]|uniref:type II toxin-antitoxin system RelE/ParE family toxin n=1 Tax=Helicobacter sp. 16-1353 TaxID=2004996 RepID=UPI000DCBEAF1|nr:type II toxin-antitoxin system YafQ family toxin [Helicobacter sp. 16-1353]RAX55319.1 type II toxin-antitoxin system mRNA interferase toxin, RelE/StbE family [Helicobacter sp. 16-1353]